MIKKLLLVIATLSLCACEKTETLYGNYTHAHIEMGGISKHYRVDETYYSNGYLRFHTSKGWIVIDFARLCRKIYKNLFNKRRIERKQVASNG